MTESVSSEPSICMVKEYDMDTLEELAAAPVQAIKDTEYETQLLGFTPKSMSDGSMFLLINYKNKRNKNWLTTIYNFVIQYQYVYFFV